MPAKKTKKAPKPKIQLVVTNEKAPGIKVKPGMRFEVASVPLVTPALTRPGKIAARLCGGTSTCIALIDLGETSYPAP